MERRPERVPPPQHCQPCTLGWVAGGLDYPSSPFLSQHSQHTHTLRHLKRHRENAFPFKMGNYRLQCCSSSVMVGCNYQLSI